VEEQKDANIRIAVEAERVKLVVTDANAVADVLVVASVQHALVVLENDFAALKDAVVKVVNAK
jgi:hypothetical protein